MEENLFQNFKNKILFADYKISDIPNTSAQAIKSLSDLKNLNYITVHVSSGLDCLKAIKKKLQKKLIKNLKF